MCPPDAPESCTLDDTGATPAIVGTNSPDQGSGVFPLIHYNESALHRFVGVGMVVALIFVTVGLWMYFAKWPRRMMSEHCCCSGRRKKGPCLEDPKPEMVSVSQLSEDLTVQGGMQELVLAKPESVRTGKWKGRVEIGWELESVKGVHRSEVSEIFGTLKAD